MGCFCPSLLLQQFLSDVCTVSRMQTSSSPDAGVPGETGLLSAGVSGRCRLPRCGPQAAAGEAAPSRPAPLVGFLVAWLPDLRRAQSVPGSAIENLRCLLSVKPETHYYVNAARVQKQNWKYS